MFGEEYITVRSHTCHVSTLGVLWPPHPPRCWTGTTAPTGPATYYARMLFINDGMAPCQATRSAVLLRRVATKESA